MTAFNSLNISEFAFWGAITIAYLFLIVLFLIVRNAKSNQRNYKSNISAAYEDIESRTRELYRREIETSPNEDSELED